MGWDVVQIGLRHNLPVNDPFATAKEVAKRMNRNVILVYRNKYMYDKEKNVVSEVNGHELIELGKFEGKHPFIRLDWRKQSMSTHSERSNPPTCEQKIGLKSAEKTEHIRSISPKTLKIARKNGALPFTCRERGVMNTEIAQKTEHCRSHRKMRFADVQ